MDLLIVFACIAGLFKERIGAVGSFDSCVRSVIVDAKEVMFPLLRQGTQCIV